MRTLLALSALLLAGPAAAGAVGPGMDLASYEKLVAKVRKDGEYVPPQRGEFSLPAYFSLKRIGGDPKGEHTAKYLSINGVVDEEGVFHMVEFRFVEESWTPVSPGINRLDQWLIGADVYGRMTDFNHNLRMHGSGKPAEDFPLTREEAGRKFLELVKLWAD